VETGAEVGILEEPIIDMNATEPDCTDEDLETHKDSPVVSNLWLDMDTCLITCCE
jgi:hypothetical protein